MTDSILDSWLRDQYAEGMSLARHSTILDLAPVAGTPPYRYVARFKCTGLVSVDGRVAAAQQHLVGINFPGDYLRISCDPPRVLSWLEPGGAFHPNIRAPFCCVGHIPPGMPLTALLQQLYQMITWQRFTPDEGDALNPAACRWARRNLERLPVDPRRSLRAAPASRPAAADGGGR